MFASGFNAAVRVFTFFLVLPLSSALAAVEGWLPSDYSQIGMSSDQKDREGFFRPVIDLDISISYSGKDINDNTDSIMHYSLSDPKKQDALIALASLCAKGSTDCISAATDSALYAQGNSTEQILNRLIVKVIDTAAGVGAKSPTPPIVKGLSYGYMLAKDPLLSFVDASNTKSLIQNATQEEQAAHQQRWINAIMFLDRTARNLQKDEKFPNGGAQLLAAIGQALGNGYRPGMMVPPEFKSAFKDQNLKAEYYRLSKNDPMIRSKRESLKAQVATNANLLGGYADRLLQQSGQESPSPEAIALEKQKENYSQNKKAIKDVEYGLKIASDLGAILQINSADFTSTIVVATSAAKIADTIVDLKNPNLSNITTLAAASNIIGAVSLIASIGKQSPEEARFQAIMGALRGISEQLKTIESRLVAMQTEMRFYFKSILEVTRDSRVTLLNVEEKLDKLAQAYAQTEANELADKQDRFFDDYLNAMKNLNLLRPSAKENGVVVGSHIVQAMTLANKLSDSPFVLVKRYYENSNDPIGTLNGLVEALNYVPSTALKGGNSNYIGTQTFNMAQLVETLGLKTRSLGPNTMVNPYAAGMALANLNKAWDLIAEASLNKKIDLSESLETIRIFLEKSRSTLNFVEADLSSPDLHDLLSKAYVASYSKLKTQVENMYQTMLYTLKYSSDTITPGYCDGGPDFMTAYDPTTDSNPVRINLLQQYIPAEFRIAELLGIGKVRACIDREEWAPDDSRRTTEVVKSGRFFEYHVYVDFKFNEKFNQEYGFQMPTAIIAPAVGAVAHYWGTNSNGGRNFVMQDFEEQKPIFHLSMLGLPGMNQSAGTFYRFHGITNKGKSAKNKWWGPWSEIIENNERVSSVGLEPDGVYYFPRFKEIVLPHLSDSNRELSEGERLLKNYTLTQLGYAIDAYINDSRGKVMNEAKKENLSPDSPIAKIFAEAVGNARRYESYGQAFITGPGPDFETANKLTQSLLPIWDTMDQLNESSALLRLVILMQQRLAGNYSEACQKSLDSVEYSAVLSGVFSSNKSELPEAFAQRFKLGSGKYACASLGPAARTFFKSELEIAEFNLNKILTPSPLSLWDQAMYWLGL